jgi:nucleotide-binding universal stress UspA family protein
MSKPVILVALDGSAPSAVALSVAEAMSEIQQASLHLVHIAENSPAAAEPVTHLEPKGLGLESLAIQIREPAIEILKIADEIRPQMIIMRNYADAGSQNILNSVATDVLRNTCCPLMSVTPDLGSAPWHLHHILVPHDGTPSNSAALRPVREIAGHAGAELLVLHVAGTSPVPTEPGSLMIPRYVDQPQHEWPAWSAEFIKRFVCICPLGNVQVRMLLAHGSPAAEINRSANEQAMDLMVVAWQGVWTEPRAAILKELMAVARCPIMVVRSPAASAPAGWTFGMSGWECDK